jgi:hypothetical protein
MTSSDRRISLAWNAIKILFSIVLVGYFFSWVNLSDVLLVWERIHFPYLSVTVILYVLLTLFKAYNYQALLQQNTNYFRILNIAIVQNSLSNFLANSAGIASYLGLLRFEENVKIRQSGLVFEKYAAHLFNCHWFGVCAFLFGPLLEKGIYCTSQQDAGSASPDPIHFFSESGECPDGLL